MPDRVGRHLVGGDRDHTERCRDALHKTEEQEAIWGGVAGEQFDHCYHLAGDTIENVSREALDVNVDAVADAIFNLAASTETVSAVAGKPIPGPGPANLEVDGPQGTFLDGGGGLDHDEGETS